jgi:2Fe-2S ferredoxin
MRHDHGRTILTTLTFILRDGTQKTVSGQSGTLMEAARTAGIAGIIGECGGACACGTCHVYLCARGLDALGPATGAEMNILEFEDNATTQSRLACQIKVATVPEGLTFTVAGDH